MTDLKIIDELLCFNFFFTNFSQMYHSYSIIRIAVDRLYEAWLSGEMLEITAFLSERFKERKANGGIVP